MSAGLPWLKLWCEARNDSKLEALNDREFRIWFKLFCYSGQSATRGSIDMIDPEFVAMELRVGVDELDSAISRMVRVRLLERSDQVVRFPAFEARQYLKPSNSPSATRERVRKHRAKKAAGNAVTRVKRDVTHREEVDVEKKKGVQGEPVVDRSTPDAPPVPLVELLSEAREALRGGR